MLRTNILNLITKKHLAAVECFYFFFLTVYDGMLMLLLLGQKTFELDSEQKQDTTAGKTNKGKNC